MSFYPSTVFFGEGRHGRERCGNENARGWSYNTTAVGFCGMQCEYNTHTRARLTHCTPTASLRPTKFCTDLGSAMLSYARGMR